ncbi:MAG: hypothetical protein E7Z65_08090 [Thermoplasmata archaeon]|nr:hypothetical protein [Thermoplasmata archaeon]
MTETFMVSKILKTHRNNRVGSPCYHYGDSNGNEADIVMVRNGKVSLPECRSGSVFCRIDDYRDIRTI